MLKQWYPANHKHNSRVLNENEAVFFSESGPNWALDAWRSIMVRSHWNTYVSTVVAALNSHNMRTRAQANQPKNAVCINIFCLKCIRTWAGRKTHLIHIYVRFFKFVCMCMWLTNVRIRCNWLNRFRYINAFPYDH